jgi:hypothetical protein
MLLMLLVFALFVCSCRQNRAVQHSQRKDNVNMAAPKIETPEFIFHRVTAGETLATIAKWYTGTESMWRDIAEDNPNLNPRNLRPGDIVKISVSLATYQKEPPPNPTKPGKATQKTNQGPQNPSADPAVPEEVFGPK